MNNVEKIKNFKLATETNPEYTAFWELFEKLGQDIANYNASGNSFYIRQKNLPYYQRLTRQRRFLSENCSPEITVADIYTYFGFSFEPEYNAYLEFELLAKPYAEKNNGYIDAIRKDFRTSSNGAYQKLKTLCEKYNVQIFDFVTLVTPFKMNTAFVGQDYFSTFVKELTLAYPNKNVHGIKRQNPRLYEKLTHISKYLPEPMTTSEVLEFLGFYNDSEYCSSGRKIEDKNEILQLLATVCPDHDASMVRLKDRQLYNRLINYARQNDTNIKTWLLSNGYHYNYGSNAPRLSQVKVNADERRTTLLTLKQKYLPANYFVLTGADKFKADVKILQQVSLELENETEETADYEL